MLDPVVNFPWVERIADADLADWTTVAVYGLGAVCSFAAIASAGKFGRSRERFFWVATAGLLVVFALNEVFDFQTLITDIGKVVARRDGWYEGRHEIQFVFVIALGIAGAVVGATLLWLVRKMHWTVHLAVAGLGSIALFILARAISFHKMDAWFVQKMPLFNQGTVQELIGGAIIALAAILYLLRRKPV